MALTAFPLARRSLLTDARFSKTQEWLAPLFQHSSEPPQLHVKAGLKVPSFRRSEIPQLRTDFV